MSKHRTYISFYDQPDATGKVIKRRTVNLPHYHYTVWKIARRICDEIGAKSFAMFQCIDVRNHEPRDYDL